MGRFHLLGCYFGSGKALAKTIAGTAYGALVGWVALLIIVNVPMPALGVVRPAIVVGVTVFFLVIVASIDLLSVVPANVYAYAAILGCRRRDREWSVHRVSAPPTPALSFSGSAASSARVIAHGGPCIAPLSAALLSDGDLVVGNSDIDIAAGQTPNLLIEVSPVLPRGACEGPRMKRAFWLLVPLIMLRTQAAELYRLDAGNTKVSLDVRLFGLPWLSVHFGDVSGEFVPDRQPSTSRVDVTVLTATCASCGQRYDQTDDYKVGDRHDGSAVFCYEFALLECRRRPILMPDVELGYIGAEQRGRQLFGNQGGSRCFEPALEYLRLALQPAAAFGALTVYSPFLWLWRQWMFGPQADREPELARDDGRDRKLLQQIASGERRALEQLYFNYHGRLGQFLSRLTGRRDAIEEAINDTFLIVWQKAGQFRGDSRASTWIMGIAWRCGLKALRRSGPLPPEHGEAILDAVSTIDTTLAAEELREWLDSGLRSLPFEQRATMEFAYFLGHSCEEIASIMSCPVNTVKARMFQARIKLRNLLPTLGGAPSKEKFNHE